MKTVRNVAIIMVLALAVAFVPGGGNAADTLFAALTIGFLAAIAWLLYSLSRQNQLTLATLSDGRRAILYGGFGLIAAPSRTDCPRKRATSPSAGCAQRSSGVPICTTFSMYATISMPARSSRTGAGFVIRPPLAARMATTSTTPARSISLAPMTPPSRSTATSRAANRPTAIDPPPHPPLTKGGQGGWIAPA